MLRRWGQPPKQMINSIAEQTTVRVNLSDISRLHRFLTVNNLLSPSTPVVKKYLHERSKAPPKNIFSRILFSYLFFRIPLVRPDDFLSRTLPVVRLAARLFRVALIPLLFLALFVLVRQWPQFIHTFSWSFTTWGMVMYALAVFGAKAAHELGHAYAAKHWGLRVPTLGVAFMVLWPIFYTDNTDSWRLADRMARMAIVAAGMLVELTIAILATLLWAVLPEGPARGVCFILASATWISSVAVNAIPFMRFDGYYFFSDLLDIPNLHQRAFAMGRWFLHRLFFGSPEPAPEILSSRRQALLVLFALATWVYRLVLFTGIALVVYHLAFKMLGTLLFSVEIAWFVGRPVFREILTWPKVMGQAGVTRNSVLFFLFVGGLVLWMVLPGQNHVRIPAILRPGQGAWIYPPAAGYILTVAVENTAKVRAGTVLLRLASPDLEHKIRLAESRERFLVTRLNRESGNSALREQHRVTGRQLAQVRTALAGLHRLKEQLVIRAATDAMLFDPAPQLCPGLWVNPQTPLFLLVDPCIPSIQGFVPETMLQQIRVGAACRFYPDIPERSTLDGKLKQVESSGIRRLDEPYPASVFGGKIPVVPGEDGLHVRQGLYRVAMAVDGKAITAFQVTPGTLVIKALPRSPVFELWRRICALFVRESGF